jgi:nucleotide-binding universal stress UspA family protein
MSQRILVPLDGSPLAELALSEALTLAQLPDSQVLLLRVIPSIEDVISDGETFTIDQQCENRAGHARDYLRGICERPRWREVKHEVAVELGDPANVILDFAQRNAIDRIILCTHGRTGVSRWVHGSVARKVLEAADRTVVLVRAGLPKGA